MKSDTTNLVVVALLLSWMPFFTGCFSDGYSVRVKNASGAKLERVSLVAGENKFTFGVLSDGRKKGFGNAESQFGNTLPSKIDVAFTPVNGIETVKKDIILPRLTKNRSILLTIDSEFRVKATAEE